MVGKEKAKGKDAPPSYTDSEKKANSATLTAQDAPEASPTADGASSTPTTSPKSSNPPPLVIRALGHPNPGIRVVDSPQTPARERDTWQTALKKLDKVDQDRLQELLIDGQDHIGVLSEVVGAVNTRKDERLGRKRWLLGRGGKSIDIHALYSRIAQWVSKFREIGDAAVQYDPGHAVLPWVAVRFILQVTTQSMETLSAAIQTVERTSHIVAKSAVLEQLYLGHTPAAVAKSENFTKWRQVMQNMKKALVALYAEILTHLSKVLHYFRQSSAKHVLLAVFTLPESQSEQLATLQMLQTNVDNQVSLAENIKSDTNMAVINEVNNDLKRGMEQEDEKIAKQENSLKKLLSDLMEPFSRLGSQIQELRDGLQADARLKLLNAISNAAELPFKRHHEEAKYSRIEGSGTWLVGHDVFRHWWSGHSSSALWLTGIPGSGKTKLTSLVIDKLKKEGDHVAHFYCRRTTAEPQRGQAEHVLRALVRQLASTDPHAPILDPIRSRLQDVIDGLEPIDQVFWSVEELTTTLTELTEEYVSVAIVIDSLDELDEDNRLDLLDAIRTVLESSSSTIKVFLSSRDSVYSHDALENCVRLRVSPELNEEDLHNFVHDKLEKFIKTRKLLKGKVPDDLRHEIKSKISAKAQGMFRWAELQLESLKGHASAREIRKLLGLLPDTLETSYWNVLEPMLSSDKDVHKLAIFTFQLLMVAPRVVTSAEVLKLFQYSEASPSDDSVELLDDYDEETLLEACSNFVVAYGEPDTPKMLSFAHLSVREFLEGLDAARKITTFTPPEIHKRMATLTLTYLNTILRDDDFERPAALSYAVRYAMFHVNELCSDNNELDELIELETTFEATAKSWFKCFDIYENIIYAESTTLLTFVSGQGYVNLAHLLLENGANVNGSGAEDDVPLIAVNKAHWIRNPEPIVQLLLGKGADPMRKDSTQKIPLHYAVDHGDAGVAKLLLQNRSHEQLFAEDDWQEIALQKAIERPHLIPILLADESAPQQLRAECGKKYKIRQGTVFRLAAMYGQPETFRQLLAHDQTLTKELLLARWPAQDNQYIMHEVVAGVWGANSNEFNRPNIKLRLATLAIEAGAEVDSKDDQGKTPLSLIERTRAFKPLAQLLVTSGADPLAKDNKGNPALTCADAIKMDCFELFEKLVEGDPSRLSEPCSPEGATLLHYSSQLGRQQIAKLLVDKGLDVNAQDKDGSTPLHVAAFGGHTAIVQNLVAHRARLDVQDNDGFYALDCAVLGGVKETIRIFMMDYYSPAMGTSLDKVGNDIEKAIAQRDSLKSRRTITIPDWRLENNHDIIYHARNDLYENVETILDRELCDIEHVDPRWHKTALHWTAETGSCTIVELLLKRGANPAAQDDFGNIPLHYATEKGFLETSKALVAGGSPLLTVDGWGRTPLQAAQQHREFEVAQWLEGEISRRTTVDGLDPLDRQTSSDAKKNFEGNGTL